MKIQKIKAVYFSPCGSVKKVVMNMASFAAGMMGVDVDVIDFTLPEFRSVSYSFEYGDLVFFGSPVYAGRIPNKIAPYIAEGFNGNGACAVPVVCYGNRAFDDALAELRNLLEADGFRTVAAAATVSEHAFTDRLAPGRPNEADIEEIRKFAVAAAEKCDNAQEDYQPIRVPGANPPEKYYTPLKEDGTPAQFLKAKPQTEPLKCTKCGICAEVCPMGCLEIADQVTASGVCIKCQACVKACPENAIFFTDEDFLSHTKMIGSNYEARKENQFFL